MGRNRTFSLENALVAMMVLVALCSIAVIGLGMFFWVGENMRTDVSQRNETVARSFKSHAEFFIDVLERDLLGLSDLIAKNHSFLANMSHEIRTPMNAVIGFSEIVSKDKNLSADSKEHLSIVQNSGKHLLNLINDILDLSKIEAGRIAPVYSSVKLRSVLWNLETMFHSRANEKGLELAFQGIETLPEIVVTDPGKLRQILINLLSNAIKFTSEGRVTCHVVGRIKEPGDGSANGLCAINVVRWLAGPLVPSRAQ